MSRSTPNSFQDDINRLVHVFLNRVEQLKMRLIYGVQIIRGANGYELEFASDGTLKYDNDVIAGGELSNLWESDGAGTTSLKTPEDISAGTYDFRTSGSFTISTSNQLNISHNGGTSHQIIASDTGGLDIQAPNGSIDVTCGGNFNYDGEEVLTHTWSSAVDANAKALSNLYSLDFYSTGYITVADTGYMYFDSGTGRTCMMSNLNFLESASIENLKTLEFTNASTTYTTTFQTSDSQTQNNIFTLPVNDGSSGQVLTTNGSGVLSWGAGGSGGVTNPMTSDLAAGGYNIKNVDYLTFNSGDTSYMYDDGSGNLGFTAATTASVNGGTSGVIITGGTAGIVLTPATGHTVQMGGDVDINENKFYLYKGATDAASVYVWADTANSKVVWHYPSGWTFDTTVG